MSSDSTPRVHTQATYEAALKPLRDQLRTLKTDEALDVCDAIQNIHHDARRAGLRLDGSAETDDRVYAQVREEADMRIMKEQCATCPPPAGMISAILAMLPRSAKLSYAYTLWQRFSDRVPTLADLPNPITAEHAAGVLALDSHPRATSWADVEEAMAADADRIDPYMPHPFAKDEDRPNAFKRAIRDLTEGGLRALADLCRVAAPARSGSNWRRLSYRPVGCTDSLLADLEPTLRSCARLLSLQSGDPDREEQTDAFRFAPGVCLVAGLGVEITSIVANAPGMPPYFTWLGGLAKRCMDPSNPTLYADREAYVKEIIDAHRMCGVPLSWLRLDWMDVRRELEKEGVVQDFDSRVLSGYLAALGVCHLFRHLRSSCGYEKVTARYRGLWVESGEHFGGPMASLGMALSPREQTTQAVRDALRMPRVKAKPEFFPGVLKAGEAAWNLVTPRSLAPLRPVGSEPALIVAPCGVQLILGENRDAAEWLRVGVGLDGVAAQEGSHIYDSYDLSQAQLARLEFPVATSPNYAAWRQQLPRSVVPQRPSEYLRSVFPNLVLPQDPAVCRGYLAVLDVLFSVILERDAINAGAMSRAFGREFPIVFIYPNSGRQSTGRGVSAGKDFQTGKTELLDLWISASRNLTRTAFMASVPRGKDGDIAERQRLDILRHQGCMGVDEFPMVRLAADPREAKADGAFSADGLATLATGGQVAAPVAYENAGQVGLDYTLAISGKIYTSIRDDIASRGVNLFLGPIAPDAQVQADLANGIIAQRMRLSVIAWLTTGVRVGWLDRITSRTCGEGGWRFPAHAGAMAALGLDADVDDLNAAYRWWTEHRADLGDEAEEAGIGAGTGLIADLVARASDAAFAIAVQTGKQSDSDPSVWYIDPWEIARAFADMRDSSIPRFGEEWLMRNKLTKSDISKQLRKLWERKKPVIYHDRWVVSWTNADASPLKGSDRKICAAVRMQCLDSNKACSNGLPV